MAAKRARGLVTLDELREGLAQANAKLDGLMRAVAALLERPAQAPHAASVPGSAPDVPGEVPGLAGARTCGGRAGQAGRPPRACPYPHGHPLHDPWMGAYQDGLRRRAEGQRQAKARAKAGLVPGVTIPPSVPAWGRVAYSRGVAAREGGLPLSANTYGAGRGAARHRRMWERGWMGR